MNSTKKVDPLQATRDAIIQEELWIVSFETQERMAQEEIERLNNDLVVLKDKIEKKRLIVAELSEKLQSQLAKNGGGDELTVHQAASRMRHDLYTKGMARTEDVVKVLGDPAKSISVSLLPSKH